jgi:5-methyltetrahydrofolate--homocysteine methyltransferase
MDGAMGTALMAAGLRVPEESAASWNRSHPDRVRAVHDRYITAGAECIVTNTFDLAGQLFSPEKKKHLYVAGVSLARTAAGAGRWVFASFSSPCSTQPDTIDPSDPIGPIAADVADQVQQMEALRDVSAILLETQTQLGFADQVVRELERTKISLPLIVSFAFGRIDSTNWLGGADKPELVGRWAQSHRDHLSALGVNCGNLDMDEFVEIVRRCKEECDLPILARPSAGIPRETENGLVFPLAPETMAAHVPALLDSGVVLLGGCCGTTAEYIAAFRPLVKEWNRSRLG